MKPKTEWSEPVQEGPLAVIRPGATEWSSTYNDLVKLAVALLLLFFILIIVYVELDWSAAPVSRHGFVFGLES
jgi:hypothetical protein